MSGSLNRLSKRKEASLRRLIKDKWGDEASLLSWVEHARGGTVGIPDVFLPCGFLWIPAELKCWVVRHGNAYIDARPSQVQYHFNCARHRKKTLVIALLCGDSSWDGELIVTTGWHFAAHRISRDERMPLDDGRIAILGDDPKGVVGEFVVNDLVWSSSLEGIENHVVS